MSELGNSRVSRQAGTRWLVMIVLVFCISVVVSMVQLKATVRLLDYRPGTTIWALFQLKGEYRNLRNTLRLYSHNQLDHDELMLSYDILWSRFPVLLEGLDAQQLRTLDGGIEVIQDAFARLQRLESGFLELAAGDRAGVTLLIEQLSVSMGQVDELALNNYHHNNQFFRKNDERMKQLQAQLGYLLLGILFSGSFLLFMLIRENQRNRYQALHDSLTDMPNRKMLRQRMSQLVKADIPFAFHLLDLNGFKEVNDTLGHQAGDDLLRAVAKRLRQQVALPYDFMVARLGGDEFAVLQFPMASAHEAREIAQQIIDALKPAFEAEGNSCFVGASIGTALYPEHARRVRDLLSRADLAMYQAKRLGPESAVCFFEDQFNDQLKRRQMLHRDLRDALKVPASQFHLEYQPLVELGSQVICSLEALLRWRHPELGLVPPLETIEVAEQYGLGQQLGAWVINEVCRQNREWIDAGAEPICIAVNISPSMYRSDLLQVVCSALDENRLDGSCLTIEVTEDTTIKHLDEAGDLLVELQARGVTVALDDFGTGLSSLSHLQELPIQILKIDRSFVSDLVGRSRCPKLIGGIIQLGQTLNMRVVAEGIEDQAVEQLLRGYGCEIGQGYLYSRPVVAELIPELVRARGLVARREAPAVQNRSEGVEQ